MAHYARVNKDSVVIYVTPIPNEMITDVNGVEHEEWAFKHLYETIPDSLGDKWVQTSYHGNFRVRGASLGMIYNKDLDAFMFPKPYPSWILNQETVDWESPIGPAPELTQEQIKSRSYYEWNEENQEWVLKTA